MMKEFKTYRELKKATRKYWKRNARKEVCKIDGKKVVSYWTFDIWCYYLVTHIEEYHKSGFQYDIDPERLPEFIKKTNSLIGKNVKVGVTTGLLEGIAFTNNGAYYALREDSEHIRLIGLIEATEIG